ncbi:hypothetical protein ELQ90_02000 [Labedella phragmitis]|uniref:Uncharacterized protein n=1 Tax=Labedella phragmitis TaxID=2498849 RepID=A0A3S3ZAX1_9MICO|nr:hypothetical protein [Labedella phragmitis]RWZ52740.1 hypothetical protein ELQ90_02000 [Labedella phragmitis]
MSDFWNVPWAFVAVAVAIVISAAPFGFARSTTARRKALDRLAKSVNLAVPTARDEDERIGARLATRERCIAIGGGLGIVAAILASFFVPGFGDYGFASMGVFILALVGVAAGAAVSALSTTRDLPSDVPRIARLTTPTVRDYLPRLESVSATVAVALAVVATVAAIVTATTTMDANIGAFALPIVITVLAVASLVGVALVSRRIVERGQRAGSTLELAWDDAIRSTALRDLIGVPLILGFAGVLVPMVVLIEDVPLRQPYTSADNIVAIVAMGVVGLVVLIGLVVAIVSVASRPQQYYRRRLWPLPERTATAGTGSVR